MRRQLSSPDGFAAFYERHGRKLVTFFARRVYDPQLALDLTAETFAQALLSVRRLRAETDEEAVAWLYGIARNQLKAFYRRGRAERRALERLRIEVPELDEESERRIERLAELTELRAALADGLAELSEAERSAVELRVVHELPYPEVAARLQVSEVAARARVSRGLRALAAALDAHGSIEGEVGRGTA
jgi:RNA polymerase sigma factor (sigma-70 family)